MPWQDIALAITQLIFAAALFPSILSKDKPAFATSLMNSIMLYVISYVNLTLNLYGAAAGLFLVATLWGILAIQKYLINKKQN
jgi:hypothetical protein